MSDIISANAKQKIGRLQWITIVWMCVEFGVGLFAGNKSDSIALLTFSGDSFVELLSASVVLLHLYGAYLVILPRSAAGR